MFELSVAWKYLLPRRRQLSVSIISLISIFVIALVVWLVVLFFSITNGMERHWISKLIAITAPVRVTPTDAYYRSYYNQIDELSSTSGYTHKSLGQKLRTPITDPYDPSQDEEIPEDWESPHLASDGSLKDLVKETFKAIEGLKVAGLHVSDYEAAFGNIRIRLLRLAPEGESQAFLSQAAVFGSLDPNQPELHRSILPLTDADIANSQRQLGHPPYWLKQTGPSFLLPREEKWGEGVFLPKAFRDAGVLIGDQGYLSYQSPTISTLQEQRIPLFVAGFYDPGIIPIGGKFILTHQQVTSLIRSAYEQQDNPLTNGLNVSFADYREADRVKREIERTLREQGLHPYWKVETFRQYEFAKELLQQLRSDKNLSMIIASVIILVACSNIVSMLVILVNDKKLEIGILRSMGASSGSIALIFGLCGVVMGLMGSLLGTVAAIVTLHQLDKLIAFIEGIQGYDLFSPTFYGTSMPNELSYEGLAFVLLTTTLISILAGVIPAVKASLLKPSAILRSE